MSENLDPTDVPGDGEDQDADPPTDGIPGPVHAEDPAEGLDVPEDGSGSETSQTD
jgi:hypothetical protein